MYDVKISPEARNDLIEIKNYISFELDNPIASQNTVSRITNSIRRLSKSPDSGTPLASIINMQTNYRFLVCGNYLVFYHREDNNVFVTRILYGKRDYLKILFEIPPVI